ncbi:BBM_1a_G0047060.mRNA.1.CDS.1 [Saccharomyces cerevisiae]|nr:CPI_1c_G0046950.mRNA.1.CDS.1 [Saccharomyces cerevisiae]CAI4755763.1 BBM_1a_G0047060.mRNA.1.CDS.1 [Saccharomyces cerevisiae]CAI7317776.1 BBM_1a_G0047060.mRNA.1.CDS.1 [Saccharomyces cerevisiae]CAI7449642.1 CPI_1c_G0046950.mRNA.1.CDS.1 [Saccharomyces cerevisiae]
MILFHALYVIWVFIFLPLLNAEEFIPKVTETLSEYTFNLVNFDDSNTLIRLDNMAVWISFDSGENWKMVKDIEERQGFCFDICITQIYVTNDGGKSWRALTIHIPKEYRISSDCVITTHPTKKEYLIADCPSYTVNSGVLYDTNEIYLTHDGESFYKIESSLKKKDDDDITTSRCDFVESSKESDISGNDASIICLFSNNIYDSEHHFIAAYTKLVLSTDEGRSFKEFDEFKDKVINQYKILKSHVVVLTQDDRYNEMSPMDIWISNDASTFQKAHLPAQLRHVNVNQIDEDTIGRIIIPISRMFTDEKNDQEGSSGILISDSQGLKFSPVSWTRSHQFRYIRLAFPDFLKGTIFGSFHSTIDYSHHKGKYGRKMARDETKISVDNGFTWSNLKVVDRENADSFGCDITRSERCSLQDPSYDFKVSNPSTGIMLMTGSVGDGSKFDWKDQKTFISRDSGLTWRLAHNSSGLYATGDLGNIIVYIPYHPNEDGDLQSEFYYSLDQGATWSEYELTDGVSAIRPPQLINTTPDGSGSKFILSGMLISTADQEGNIINFSKSVVYAIDLSAAFDYKTREEGDFEDWNLADGKCVNGAKYKYRRRKQDTRCLVKKALKDLSLDETPCNSCAASDYECSFEFVRDTNGQCVPDYNLITLSYICDKSKGKSVLVEPLQLIKGDKCKTPMKIEPVDIPCDEIPKEGSNGKEIVLQKTNLTLKFDFINTLIQLRTNLWSC